MSLPRALVHLGSFLLFLSVFAFVLAAPARAEDLEEKIEDLEDRIEILVEEMKILWNAGHKDAAELLEKRVHALRREHAKLGQRVAHEDEAEDDVEEVLDFVVELLGEVAQADNEREAVDLLVEALREVADEAEEPRRNREIEIAKRRLAVMRTAFTALREGEKRDAMELMEHAIHALELGIAGRRDAEAQKIRHGAPNLAQQIDLLELAAELWAGFGHETKAAQVAALARELAANLSRRSPPRARIQLEAGEVKRYLNVMKMTLPAFREVERPELAQTMQKAIRALEVQLEGRADEEAKQIVANAPKRETVIELLLYAADLYRKWGNEDKAHACQEAGQSLLRRHREAGKPAAQARRRAETPRGHAEAVARFEQLQKQTAQLLEMAQRMHRELQRLQQEMKQER